MRPKQRLSSWGVSWTSAGLFASDVVLYYLAFYRAKLGRFCGRFFAGCCFGASWVPARALGECCGLRIRVRISGSCFGSAAATVAGAGWIRCGDLRVVNLVDLRQLRPWGRCGALSAGGISGGAWFALEGCGPSWVPARALGECCGSGSASGAPAAAALGPLWATVAGWIRCGISGLSTW